MKIQAWTGGWKELPEKPMYEPVKQYVEGKAFIEVSKAGVRWCVEFEWGKYGPVLKIWSPDRPTMIGYIDLRAEADFIQFKEGLPK